MAKKKSSNIAVPVRGSDATSEARIIDLQIQITPRGRSVMNGTLLRNGVLETIHRDLSADDISSLARVLFGLILDDET